jgi:hypothetical protein
LKWTQFESWRVAAITRSDEEMMLLFFSGKSNSPSSFRVPSVAVVDINIALNPFNHPVQDIDNSITASTFHREPHIVPTNITRSNATQRKASPK